MSFRVDQRRHRRIRGAGISGSLKVDGASTSRLRVEDMSMGGAQVLCATACRPGKNVLLRLSLPGLEQVRVVGRVLSCEPAGDKAHALHLRFNPLPGRLPELLRALMDAWEHGRDARTSQVPVRSARVLRQDFGDFAAPLRTLWQTGRTITRTNSTFLAS